MSAPDEEFDFSADTFDTRELVERIDWLKTELIELDEQIPEDHAPDDYVSEEEDRELLREELTDLETFAADLESYAGDNLDNGNTVIADSFFTEYAEELAGELYGEAVTDAQWPFVHIDWDEAAEALKMDYSEIIDPRGNSWWVR